MRMQIYLTKKSLSQTCPQCFTRQDLPVDNRFLRLSGSSEIISQTPMKRLDSCGIAQ